ncbi:MAG: phosphodiesterase [Proteobacteria bacterium]|nr:phosphodiesterase [Pseudomonadota bacterium]
MLIAQMTDLHIKPPGQLAYGRVDTAAMLRAAIASLIALRPAPDALLLTGDLVDAGGGAEYALLRALLAPVRCPIYLIPGNHDERAALRAGFADHAYLPPGDGFIQYVIDDHAVRLIGLDTLVPGEAGGRLCTARLDWLAAQLDAAPARPTVVFLHHPPFATGIAHMDRIGLDGAAPFAALIRRHAQVECVLAGHLHRPIQARWAGTVASTAPAPCHQVVLDLNPDGPAHFVMEPPGYQLHRYTPEAGIVSHTVTIGRYPGPHPFRDAGRPAAN